MYVASYLATSYKKFPQAKIQLPVLLFLVVLHQFAIFLQKWAIFNIDHIFTRFVKLCGSRFLYFFSPCDVRNEVVFQRKGGGDAIPDIQQGNLHDTRIQLVVRKEVVFLLLEHSSLRGVKQKKHKKKHEIVAFELLLQEI